MKGKKADIEALFAKGLTPDSPELAELGLKRKTVQTYFRKWKKAQTGGTAGFTVEIKPAAPKTVGDLVPRQLFTYQGLEYRVNQILPDKVHVLMVEDAPAGGYKIERLGRYLPKETKVIPK